MLRDLESFILEVIYKCVIPKKKKGFILCLEQELNFLEYFKCPSIISSLIVLKLVIKPIHFLWRDLKNVLTKNLKTF